MIIEEKEFYHKTLIQLRFSDIDRIGHVNNSIHQQYFDLARINYFNTVFNESLNWDEEALVIANITVTYLIPIYLDEKISIYTKIIRIGNKSLEIIQYIINEDNNEIKSMNTSIMVGYNSKMKKSILIPDKWRNSIAYFEKNESLKSPKPK